MIDAAVILILIVTLLIVAIIVTKDNKDKRLFQPRTVFILFALIYFYAIPVELWLIGSNTYQKGENIVTLSDYNILVVMTLSLLSIVSFIIGMRLGGENRILKKDQTFFYKFEDKNLSKIIALLSLGYILFIFIYVEQFILTFLSYELVAGVHFNNPLFTLIQYSMLFCFAFMSTRLYLMKRYVLFVIIILIPIIYGILSSDKNPILMGVLTTVYCISRNKSYKLSHGILSFIFVFVALILVRAFSIWRADINFIKALVESMSDFSFTKIDPAGAFISINYYLNMDNHGYGITFYENIEQLIPKIINENRSYNIAEKFAQEQISNWMPGLGLGFSPMAEAVYNFSMLAPVYFTIIGIYWGLFWRVIKKIWHVILPKNHFEFFYIIIGCYFIALSFRGSSLNFFKIMPMYVISLMIILYVFKIVTKKWSLK